jgi:hypothetical protein
LSALVGSAAADGPLSFSSCGGGGSCGGGSCGSGVRQLTSLGLRYTNVTDKTLFCLAANCHQLTHLDLKGIDNVVRKQNWKKPEIILLSSFLDPSPQLS